MKNIINYSIKALLGLFVVTFIVQTHAASTGIQPDSWVADVTVVEDVGVVTVSFKEQSSTRPPVAVDANLNADETVSAEAFVGSYGQAGIEGLSFKLMVDSTAVDVPRGVSLFIIGANDIQWVASGLLINNVSGEWVVNNITIDSADHGVWDREMPRGSDNDEAKNALWLETLNAVKMIGFDFNQQGIDPQSYSVSDFRLIGNGFVSDAAVLTRLQDHLNQEISNVDQLTVTQLTQDSDGDGVTDYDAIMLLDKDPGLQVKVLKIETDGITLEWPKAANKKYALLRCSSLVDGFNEVVLDDEISVDSGQMTYKDGTATNDVPYFYRVIKKEK